MLLIQSLDPRWGLDVRGYRRIYTPSKSLSHSLFTRLIPLGLLEAGAQGISIALLNQSVDRTLQIVLFKQALMEWSDLRKFQFNKVCILYTED